MNYIKQLQQDLRFAQYENQDMREKLLDLKIYLLSEKFYKEDYVYVRTDMLPKLDAILTMDKDYV